MSGAYMKGNHLVTGFRFFAVWILLNLVSLSALAEPWTLGEGYIGTWQSGQKHHKFQKYASKIMFELWASSESKPQGIALFYKGKNKYCVGELVTNIDNTQLRFKPIDEAECKGFSPGYFKIGHAFDGQRTALAFVPDGVEYTAMLALYNSVQFRKLPSAPPELARLVALARGTGQSIAANLKQSASTHADVIRQFHEDSAGRFKQQFAESQLIGSWRGYFIDKQQRYLAEIAIWSMKDNLLYKLVGLIRFEGQECPAVLQVQKMSEHVSWLMGSHGTLDKKSSCYRLGAGGSVRLSDDGKRIVVYLRQGDKNNNSLGMDNCLQELPHIDGSKRCQNAGAFSRAAVSDAFDQTMASIQWSDAFKRPGDAEWSLLKHNDAAISQLVAAHEEGLKANEAFYAQLEKNRAEAQRQREKKIRQQIAEKERKEMERQERIRQTEEEWARRQSGKGGLAPIVLPELPKVSGPLDGLRGGEFLNALYHRNYEAIDEFDNYYQLRKIKQRRDWVGEHWSDEVMDSAVKKIRLADTVLAIYMFEYQDKYKACLKKGAVTYTVTTTTPDVEHRNLLGSVVYREYGSTERQSFTINKEFETAFKRLGTTEPENSLGYFSDRLLNLGGTDLRWELVSGTRQMMNNFKCDSDVIKRVENTLLTYSTR